MKRSNATDSLETKAVSVHSLSLSLSLPLQAIFRNFSVANQSIESKPIKEQDVEGHVFDT